MGKYMRKGKGVGEVAVMEVSTQGVSLGVRTRARTLASQRSEHKRLASTRSSSSKQQQQQQQPRCLESSSSMQGHTCYMELRSRKLQKILPSCSCYHEHVDPKTLETVAEPSSAKVAVSDEATLPGSNSSCFQQQKQQSSVAHSRNNSATFSQTQSNINPARTRKKEPDNKHQEQLPSGDADGIEVEVSFGENIMDQDSRERRTRETTPSSYIKDTETPGSSTRPPPPTTRRRLQQQQHESEEARRPYEETNTTRLHVPTSNEIEDFFASAEQEEQRRFTERYNYDPVSDSPLPGRFEWIRLRH